MPDLPWYSDGLRFECTQCGRCCSGAPGYVLFTSEEAERIAERLGVSVQEFLDRYTTHLKMPVSGRSRTFKEIESEHGNDCIFLDRATQPGKTLCAIHDLRPAQCRTFPFWPEHVESPRSWQRLSRECEGIERGPIVPLTQIRVQVEISQRDRARQ
ncbi:MAG: YkgJ family cysteine cluster protein [Phycisphaerae bacterium]|nr:YkgJ family cysteine cluster protein [Phycisphaerae bacterium]